MHFEDVRKPSFKYEDQRQPIKSANNDIYSQQQQSAVLDNKYDASSEPMQSYQKSTREKTRRDNSSDVSSETNSVSAFNQSQSDQPGFASFFTHDLQNATQVTTDHYLNERRSKSNYSSSNLLGIRLAKGKNLQYVRRKWFRMKGKYRKLFYNMEPLIINEPKDHKSPVQLIVGPFLNASKAVKLCKSIRLTDCNIKLYSGTPL